MRGAIGRGAIGRALARLATFLHWGLHRGRRARLMARCTRRIVVALAGRDGGLIAEAGDGIGWAALAPGLPFLRLSLLRLPLWRLPLWRMRRRLLPWLLRRCFPSD